MGAQADIAMMMFGQLSKKKNRQPRPSVNSAEIDGESENERHYIPKHAQPGKKGGRGSVTKAAKKGKVEM